MADDVLNKMFIKELLEKTKLSDDDILIAEDSTNTKRVSFRNFRDSLISDNELPSTHRMYSSKKLDDVINDFQEQIDLNIGQIAGRVEKVEEGSISSKEVDKKIEEFSKTVADLIELDNIKQAIDLCRKTSDPITCDDIESGEDAKKIQPKNLSYEVISMMVGTTPVTAPAVPKGGWVQEDIANGAINAAKLAKQYRYRGHKLFYYCFHLVYKWHLDKSLLEHN